jgi:FtsP/CotA-like multicopper oxidase with cupredoxin domain
MTGGTKAPGWERGRDLPTFLLPWKADHPGPYVGALFAGAPGSELDRSEAEWEAAQAPTRALVARASDVISFRGRSVRLVLAALADEHFEADGMADPAIVVPTGARVSIKLLNEDRASAHGLVVAPLGSSLPWRPMAEAGPAFRGSALWFLGDMREGRAHEGTVSFYASRPGCYRYLDPVPGQAQAGMAGAFVVEAHP